MEIILNKGIGSGPSPTAVVVLMCTYSIQHQRIRVASFLALLCPSLSSAFSSTSPLLFYTNQLCMTLKSSLLNLAHVIARAFLFEKEPFCYLFTSCISSII